MESISVRAGVVPKGVTGPVVELHIPSVGCLNLVTEISCNIRGALGVDIHLGNRSGRRLEFGSVLKRGNIPRRCRRRRQAQAQESSNSLLASIQTILKAHEIGFVLQKLLRFGQGRGVHGHACIVGNGVDGRPWQGIVTIGSTVR